MYHHMPNDDDDDNYHHISLFLNLYLFILPEKKEVSIEKKRNNPIVEASVF